jgi:hypothetical protein
VRIRSHSVNLSVATLVGLAVSFTGPATGVAASPSTPAAQAAAVPVLQCDRDSTLIMPFQSSALDDGWIVDTYAVGDGIATIEVPPVDFDPMTAPNATLARHGIEQRPSAGAAVSDWTDRVGRIHPSRIRGLCQTNIYNATVKPDTSQVWSGYEPYGSAYRGAKATFVQPTYVGTGNCTNSASETSWLGIGGVNTAFLTQLGTQMYLTNNGATKVYKAFYELYPNPSLNLGLTGGVHPGDSISLQISHPPNQYNSTLTMANNSTHYGIQITVLDQSYDPSTADYIDERPSISVGGTLIPLPLAQYGTVSWSGLQVQQWVEGSWAGAYSQNRWQTTMKNSSGTVLSVPGTMGSGSSFVDTWKNCGP